MTTATRNARELLAANPCRCEESWYIGDDGKRHHAPEPVFVGIWHDCDYVRRRNALLEKACQVVARMENEFRKKHPKESFNATGALSREMDRLAKRLIGARPAPKKQTGVACLIASVLPLLDDLANRGCYEMLYRRAPQPCGKCVECQAKAVAAEVRAALAELQQGEAKR